MGRPPWGPRDDTATGYGQQPHVVGWNLARLLEASSLLVDDLPSLQAVLDDYGSTVGAAMRRSLRSKLGPLRDDGPSDDGLLDTLPSLLSNPVTDWTRFHRLLARVRPPSVDADPAWVALIADAFYGDAGPAALQAWAAWLRRWHTRTLADHDDDDARQVAMDAVNPRIVLRNWIVQQAIEADEEGDEQPVRDLLEVVQPPFADIPEDPYDALEPEWDRDRPGCSLLSCSS